MLAQNPTRLRFPISTPKIPCTTISYNSGEKSIRRESLRRRSRRASTGTRRRRRGLHVKRANGRRRTRRTRKLRAGLIRCVGSRHYFSLSVLEVDPQIETGVVMTGPNVDARPVQDVVEMTALGAEHQCEGVVSDLDHLPVDGLSRPTTEAPDDETTTGTTIGVQGSAPHLDAAIISSYGHFPVLSCIMLSLLNIVNLSYSSCFSIYPG